MHNKGNYHRILNYFERTVSQHSHRIAIEEAQKTLTFSELHTQAIMIGNQILQGRAEMQNQPIVVILKESAAYVAAILGILYSGNFYVPIPPMSPKPWIQSVIQSTTPPLIITELTHVKRLIQMGVPVGQMLLVDEGSEESVVDTPLKPRSVIDVDPVYLMHTSGSTGTPKGVLIQHRSLIDFIHWVGDRFEPDHHTIMGCVNAFSFDNSILDIFTMVFFGARMVLMHGYPPASPDSNKPPNPQQRLESFARRMQEASVNWFFSVPSLMIAFSNYDILSRVSLDHLRKVLFCGEVMPNYHLNYWRRHLPQTLYANLYGPTEITDVCAYYIVDRDFTDEEPLPIGIPCENMDVFIIHEENRLAQPGETGEIMVRGTGLSPGYWNRPHETSLRFIQNPLHDHYPDWVYRTGDLGAVNDRGEILFLGRNDTQIKFHGSRVELSEIELVALTIEGMKNVCVLYHQEKQRIMMFYEADQKWDDLSLMRELHNRLPVYPTIYHYLDEFPYTHHGKTDRVVLKSLMEVILSEQSNSDSSDQETPPRSQT